MNQSWNFRRGVLLALAGYTAFLVFAVPQRCADALQAGLRLCGGPLLVSLFPFLIVSALAAGCGAGQWLGFVFRPAARLMGIRAKGAGGTVLRTNLTSGTMLVQPGQQVEAGQGLIGTARAERDGTLIFAPAAGTVVAQFEWSDTRTVPLEETVQQYTGVCTRAYRVTAFGHTFSLPAAPAPENAILTTRHYQPEVPLLGLALPCSVEETCRYEQQPETLRRTEAQAAALARLQSLHALYAAWPDAERIARKEDCTVNGTVLDYTVTYTVAADICG